MICRKTSFSIVVLLKDSYTAIIVIKCAILVSYEPVRKKFNLDRIRFSSEFLKESKVLYNNLYLRRSIVGCNKKSRSAAKQFTGLPQKDAEKENNDILFMDFTGSETVKFFTNTYLSYHLW